MEYSKKLIDEVKRIYPDCADMHRLADLGHPFLGRWLDDSAGDDVKLEEVLAIKTLKELEELKKIVLHRLRERELYAMWYNEYKTQHP